MSMDLESRARTILRANDRGGYTVPTDGLYPFQWNWDSAFVALGFATFDPPRAWLEIETLMDAQWPDGMVPHIIFHREDARYFPGPEEYGCPHTPASSGYTQPPVAAIVAHRLLTTASDAAEATGRVRRLFPRLLAWHRWMYACRVTDGMVAIAHPWESGRDNLPDWDEPLAAVDTRNVGAYQRRDLDHVDAAMRPSQEDYDRYIALVREARALGWSGDALRREASFWVADSGMTAILLRANRALRAIAIQIDAPADTLAEIDRWIEDLSTGLEAHWNPETKAYGTVDLRTGARSANVTASTFLSLFAGGIPEERAQQQVVHLRQWLESVRYAVPSFDPDNLRFDGVRYWRGPVWLVVNWMIAIGLRDFGFDDLADRVEADSRDLVARHGFHENFDPRTGRGCGGSAFSWTAAIWLDLTAARPGERGG